ncbi:carbohydrate-binding protein [Polaribacter sp.]|uniref:carbohydrate-binding protein n=3 Tax=Bacteroidota TaxID=976 RepID=UPI004048AC39
MQFRLLFSIPLIVLVTNLLTAQNLPVPKTYNKSVLMHYMPWFETPEFNQKWGSHWTMNTQNPDIIVDATTGKRQIASHFYPLIGPYSSIDPAVIEYHLLLMKYSGIDGVLIDWYGVQGSNGDINSLLTNSNALIDKTDDIGLNFAIILEDRFSRNIGDVQQNMTYMKDNYFNKSNYFRYGVSNKPFLGIFGPITFEQESDWTAIMPSAGEDLTFLTLWKEAEDAGSHSDGEYAWIFNDDTQNNYHAYLEEFYRDKANQLDIFMGVAYPGFKDFYEEGNSGPGFFTIDHNESNTLNQILQLNSQYQSNIDVLQLATWNDFGEGTMFEPTEEFGFSFLTTLQTYLGVSYGLEELEQIHRLYTLRKKYASSTTINLELDKALQQFLQLNPDQAKTTMDVIEGVSEDQIQAENYDDMFGVQFENNRTTVGFFDDGDWLLYENIDFGNTTQSIIFNLAKGNTGGYFEVRLDNLTGPLLATYYPENTGGWTQFIEQQINIEEVSGVHDLYITAHQREGVCNFDWFKLSENKIYEPNWQLFWSDEFNGNQLDETVWSKVHHGNPDNGEIQFYTPREENIEVSDGTLKLIARKETYTGQGPWMNTPVTRSYTSGKVESQGKLTFQYGKIEARMKLPRGKGTWPAFWMLGENLFNPGVGWPKCGEIDIMEHGQDFDNLGAAIHTEKYNHTIGTQLTGTYLIDDYDTNFHIYGFEWTEDKLSFYVDNDYYFTVTKEQLGDSEAAWPFDQPFWLILNQAVGGAWGGTPDDTLYPHTTEIDWVRVYKDTPLSISDNQIDNSKIKFYPNPVVDKFWLEVKNGSEKIAIRICDVNGRLIKFSYKNIQDKILVDVTGLSKGFYTIRVKTNSTSISTKFIKK